MTHHHGADSDATSQLRPRRKWTKKAKAKSNDDNLMSQFIQFRQILRQVQSRSLRARPRRLYSHRSKTQARIEQLLERLPRFLRTHTHIQALRHAPMSHVAAFLLLHEITAVVPLVGFSLAFHYSCWLPRPDDGRWVGEGLEKFARYFARKGWFGVERLPDAAKSSPDDGDGVLEMKVDARRSAVDAGMEKVEKYWVMGDSGKRILMEVATAYAFTKVLLPLRILVSVWATPWFAKTVLGRFTGMFGMGRNRSADADSTKRRNP